MHYGLWMGAVQGQGSDAQQAEYLGPSMMLQLFGCFGMTVRGPRGASWLPSQPS